MLAVRVRRIGHESLSIFVRFAPNLLSVLDPDSTLSFFATLRNSHESPSFDSSPLATYGNDPKAYALGSAICAGEKNRTPDYCLEGSRFTTKPHPLLINYCSLYPQYIQTNICSRPIVAFLS